MYSGAEFAARVADTPMSGPGADALDAALTAGGPILLVTGTTATTSSRARRSQSAACRSARSTGR
jgi:hypothetical protein